MTQPPYVSIIIPAYNEESRLPETLERVIAFMQSQPYESEVIVVENGSADRTFQIAQSYAQRWECLKVIREAQAGKGNAIRRGMLAARGEYRFMCDADLSMPIEELPRFLPPNHPGTDIVIGSREAPGAVRYHEPDFRHVGGRLVNWMIQLLALPKLDDTQCGFKIFRAPVAEDLFSHQTILGWSFDVEILFIARRRGYAIVEMGIPWYYRELSHVSPLKDAVQLFLDILKIRWNTWRGIYAQEV